MSFESRTITKKINFEHKFKPECINNITNRNLINFSGHNNSKRCKRRKANIYNAKRDKC